MSATQQEYEALMAARQAENKSLTAHFQQEWEARQQEPTVATSPNTIDLPDHQCYFVRQVA